VPEHVDLVADDRVLRDARREHAVELQELVEEDAVEEAAEADAEHGPGGDDGALRAVHRRPLASSAATIASSSGNGATTASSVAAKRSSNRPARTAAAVSPLQSGQAAASPPARNAAAAADAATAVETVRRIGGPAVQGACPEPARSLAMMPAIREPRRVEDPSFARAASGCACDRRHGARVAGCRRGSDRSG